MAGVLLETSASISRGFLHLLETAANSVFTDTHEDATETTRLDDFIGFFTQRQKSPEYTSVDFCRRSQVRTTQLPK